MKIVRSGCNIPAGGHGRREQATKQQAESNLFTDTDKLYIEMQTGTLDGSPSKHTPEIQPTADANARWAGTRTIRTYDLRSAIRFGYILY